MRHLTIGILAHVDSGKTTLSEALLYLSGELRRLGRVDHKDAFLDTFALERERGITIFSKQAEFCSGDTGITLLDTPGHVDFSAETERTLRALDLAVLVISGTDGVQSHTKTLWRLINRYKLPTFIFVNKLDLAGADKKKVLKELKSTLGGECIDFSREFSADFYEELALCGERMMDEFIETGAVCGESIRAAVAERKIYPCWFGSALKTEGVKELLAALDKYSPDKKYPEEFAARVFKVSRDEQGNRLVHLKITGGKLRVKDSVSGIGANGEPWEEKVNQIRIYSGAKFQTADCVEAGRVCSVTGIMSARAGDGLGAERAGGKPEMEPFFSYMVRLEEGGDIHSAFLKLKKLEEEEPGLKISWNGRAGEIHLQLMGEIQLEVIKRLALERFGMNIEFDEGSIAYRETIKTAAEGVGHYEPLRHYAEVHLLLEPAEAGSGLEFVSACSEDELDRNWQRLILTHLAEKTHLGVLTGSPITDMKITLTAGKAHIKHTEGGDFREATYRAVRNGLRYAESVLLEPWYDFNIEVPAENIGRAITDIQQMGGRFDSPESVGDMSVLSGSAPVAAIRGYQAEITAYTHGIGHIFCSMRGYEPCADSERVIAQIGYDCDADVENTADSVFCSHGAGVNVKWNEVHEHMHIDTGFYKTPPPAEETEEKAVRQRRAEAYIAMVSEDKELMRIFERTYGTVNREAHKAFKSVKRREPPEHISVSLPKRDDKEYLLVDGYNIIFAWDKLKKIAGDSLDAARNELINILCNYQGYRRCELILVFDAYKVKGNHGSVEKVHNINVVYTKEAETADMYIEKVSREIGKKHKVRVATSDGLEQIIIIGHGALRVSASELYDEVKQAEKDIREYLNL